MMGRKIKNGGQSGKAINPDTVANLAADDGDVANTLRRHAAEGAFDLTVMGDFAHSWVREIVLGGVTRSLLSDSRVPLFMSY